MEVNQVSHLIFTSEITSNNFWIKLIKSLWKISIISIPKRSWWERIQSAQAQQEQPLQAALPKPLQTSRHRQQQLWQPQSDVHAHPAHPHVATWRLRSAWHHRVLLRISATQLLHGKPDTGPRDSAQWRFPPKPQPPLQCNHNHWVSSTWDL